LASHEHDRSEDSKTDFELLHALPIGACVLDRSLRIVEWNRSLHDWTGLSRSDVLGHDLRIQFPAFAGSRAVAGIDTAFESGDTVVFSSRTYSGMMPLICAQSASRPTRICARRLPGGAHLLLTIQDQSELAGRAQECDELEDKLASELEHKVQLQSDLSELHDQSRNAAMAQRAFLSNMSHELRTPLTAILGYAELMGSVQFDEQGRASMIQSIRENGEQLLGVLNQALEFADIDTGQPDLKREWCSPMAVIEAVVVRLSDRAQESGVSIGIEMGEQVPKRILTDPDRLRQVLEWLVENTLKFTFSGEVRIVVRHKETRQAESLLEIDISTTGIGMSEDQTQHAFTPFTQGDGSSSRVFGGIGLGLPLSRSLARAMGGDVVAIHDDGAGATLRFTLVAEGNLSGAPPGEVVDDLIPMQTAIEKHAIIIPGCRVLLAEDDLVNQKLILKILELAEVSVDLAVDGREALNCALRARDCGMPYHVILMDMQMPVLDGYETTRALRVQGYEHPILALTANALAPDRERCLSAGCDNYEVKPVCRQELLRKIQQYFIESLDQAA
jgi:signal transduction histidine kinase/ActR/RegA family two-component response regulator